MRIAIVADCYPPMKSSAAVMIKDLTQEFLNQGCQPMVIVPDPLASSTITKNFENGVEVIRVLCPSTKDITYVRRAISEFYMPFAMIRSLKKTKAIEANIDAVVWYSPSIFHGPLVNYLKKKYNCRTYLILRDIFPQWAVDLGLMKRGIAYKALKIIENYQYSIADKIGIQSKSNLNYFSKNYPDLLKKTEVLHNWISEIKSNNSYCSISINETILAGRKIFVYAGNMGKAQDISSFLDVIKEIDATRNDIGFVFVGRGTESKLIRQKINNDSISNALIFDEIKNSEIPNLYKQCNFGLVFLDQRHKTNNIPGKFISYIHHGLPVAAFINEGNDLFDLIKNKRLGVAFEGIKKIEAINGILNIVDNADIEGINSDNCRSTAKEIFSTVIATKQIIKSI